MHVDVCQPSSSSTSTTASSNNHNSSSNSSSSSSVALAAAAVALTANAANNLANNHHNFHSSSNHNNTNNSHTTSAYSTNTRLPSTNPNNSSSLSLSSSRPINGNNTTTTTNNHNINNQHHVLCNNNNSTTTTSSGISTGPLMGTATGLPSSLPHQLSQLCNSQQYPLLALQQNFSHLLPPGYADTTTQQHFNQHENLHHQRNYHQRFHHHHHHHHHNHHNHVHEHNLTHHMRNHHNWRKSKTSNHQKSPSSSAPINATTHSLLDLSAKIVAEHIPFQSIEQRYEHIPEPVQRRIIFWSFPRHEDDIKMYSSLSSDPSSANNPTSSNSSSSSTNASQSSPPSSSNNAFAWIEHPAAAAAAAAAAVQATSSSSSTLQNSSTVTATSLNKVSQQQKQLTFHKGLRLYNEGCVQDVLQVGFSLSGLINIRSTTNNQASSSGSKIRSSNHSNNNHNNHNNNNIALNLQNNNNDPFNNHNQAHSNEPYNASSSIDSLSTKSYRASVTFDRCKITSVSCSCDLRDIFWCEHVVALILYRIRNPETIDLRVPISETLLSLDRQQLQKLVQYIIAEHHTEVLPTAQRLLDEMQQSLSEINQIQGAPDPTAGASADDEHIWHLDEYQVNDKVQNYLNMVCSNSKDAAKQINALFEKIREMFKSKDSNGTRLLKLMTEQFLLHATRNDKSRPLWDQLVSLWVVVMLNPDLSKVNRKNFMQLLTNWSKALKCPKEDNERRISMKRKAAELSDDEDSDDYMPNNYGKDFPVSFNQSNNYPAHMATHRHRAFQSNSSFPVLRPYNQLPILPSACPCQLSHSLSKKVKVQQMQHNSDLSYQNLNRPSRPSGSSSNQIGHHNSNNSSNSNENRPLGPQEPRSIFYRAIDFLDSTWDDPHLQLILNKDGPIDFESPPKSNLFDFTGNPLWNETVSQAAARVETLKSYGYMEQALRLTVATVRRLKLQQDQWCLLLPTDSNSEPPCVSKGSDNYCESWIGHPFDPINVLMDILLEASLTESTNTGTSSTTNGLCTMNPTRCSCPYNQTLAEFTHRLLPDLASLSYQHRVDGLPILPLVNFAHRRATTSTNQSSSDKTPFYHVPVPGCCHKDSYLTLAVEVALIALGQQRSIPTIATAHERAVRQEAELIAKLESIDTTDPSLIEILKHQTTLLLEGGPFQNSCCGVPTDSAPLHTYARYLFDSLVLHYSHLAYKVGVYALKMPLLPDENGENFGAARTSPRSFNHNHLQSEQLALAQTMLSKAKDEGQQGGYLRKVYRASVKNIRNPSSLLKLSKHVLKEAKPSGATLYPALLKTSFDLGLQVLKITLSPHTSNGKTRREAILFIVECATDIGLEAVLQVMRDSREYFSAIEALNLVVARDNDHVNIRSQAYSKLKLKDNPRGDNELTRISRDLVLDCACRDPTNCALEALKFCEADEESLKRALKIVMDAGTNGTMDSTQLIKVADHIHERDMTDKAFDIAMVAVDSLSIPSNSENSSSKKDIISACEYAQKVHGFSILIPKLINNIECATVLSEIYLKFNSQTTNYIDLNNVYRAINQPDIHKQRIEEARWWDALLKRTLRLFVDTTRTRLQNISPRHYKEFIDFLVKAEGAFLKAVDGPQQFKDLISEIMKSYRTKKKLMGDLKARFNYSIKAGL